MGLTHKIFEPLHKLVMWYKYYDNYRSERNNNELKKLETAIIDRMVVIKKRLENISEFEFSEKGKRFKAQKDNKGRWWLYLHHHSKTHFMRYQVFKRQFDLCMAYEIRINKQ